MQGNPSKEDKSELERVEDFHCRSFCCTRKTMQLSRALFAVSLFFSGVVRLGTENDHPEEVERHRQWLLVNPSS